MNQTKAMDMAELSLCDAGELSVVERKFGFQLPVGKLRRTALRLAIINWNERATHASLHRDVRRQFADAMREEGYSSVVICFVLLVAAEAIVGWAVQKLMDYLWDRWHRSLNKDRAAKVHGWQLAIKSGRDSLDSPTSPA